MRLSRLVPVLALALGLQACAGMAGKPTKERQPLQTDFDRCYVSAKQLGNQALQGQMTLKMYVAADGTVPFTFVNDVKGLDSAQLNHCVTNFILVSKFPGENLDYLRPYGPVTFQGASSMMPDFRDIPKVPMDEKLAQDTLEFSDWADAADRGWGNYYVHKYDDSIKAFREHLAKSPDDVRAMRGLAAALAASGGDLKEAKDLAAKAIQLKPDSESTHEAMLRVCIAAKDDNCIFDEFEKARKAPDVNVRSVELATMQETAKAAADRLQTGEHTKHEEEIEKAKAEQEALLKKVDPRGCLKKEEGEERTLCFVQGCFDKGGHTYAESLKGLTGQDYKAGKWSIGPGKGKASKVTLQIRAAEGQNHDASWDVTAGENINMQPLDIDANNISRDYNSCRK